MRAVLADAGPHAESPWESVTRHFCRTIGVPVTSQHSVFDSDGAFVARGDLRVIGRQLLVEYDGATHLDAARYQRDRYRDRRLQLCGWTRIGLTRRDLIHQASATARDLQRAAGIVDERALVDGVRAWHGLLRRSGETPAGRRWIAAHWEAPSRPSGVRVPA